MYQCCSIALAIIWPFTGIAHISISQASIEAPLPRTGFKSIKTATVRIVRTEPQAMMQDTVGKNLCLKPVANSTSQ